MGASFFCAKNMKKGLDYFFWWVYKAFRKWNGRLAQLEEHLVYTERVGSSNLSAPTNKKATRKSGFFFGMGSFGSNSRGREFDYKRKAHGGPVGKAYERSERNKVK